MWWSLGNNMEKRGHNYILPTVLKASASHLCRKVTVAARSPVSKNDPGGLSVFPANHSRWCYLAAAECLLSLGVHSSPLTFESSRAWAPDVHVVLQVIPGQTKALPATSPQQATEFSHRTNPPLPSPMLPLDSWLHACWLPDSYSDSSTPSPWLCHSKLPRFSTTLTNVCFPALHATF